ncbi:MAG: DUF975 family protein [Lachnospiraceae bacterium]|nr:DUF975 family protein [Lachnospiraceae bacterium]
MKKHYWRVVAICFIVTFMAGSNNNTLSAVFSYDSSKEALNAVQENTVFDVNDIREKKPLDFLLEQFEKRSQEEEEIMEKSPYKEGVFSAIFNRTTATGSVFAGIIALLLDPLLEGAWLSLISAAAGAALLFFWWLLIRNIIQVGSCRFFLEAHTYNNTKGNRIFFLYKIGRMWRVALIMLRKFLYQWLWSLTIIGGWIKGYSYLMVPYLAAENPNLKGREAIDISRQMMQGNKWRAFVLDCSFLGWHLLSILTLGLVDILYANPYKAGARAELYLKLREQALLEGAGYGYAFTDLYLTCPSEEEELRAAYEREAVFLEGTDWKEQRESIKASEFDVFEEYPTILFTVPEAFHVKRPGINYHCKYGITGIILLFFLFSFAGWCWEVGLHMVQSGEFVNRGVFHGPWLPIYGSGGVLVLVALKKLRDRPVATFFMTVLLCGIVEYATSWGLEQIYGVRWWDYSGYFLQLNGRICAEGLLVFGLGGCAFIYILAPLIMEFGIRRLSMKVRIFLCILLLVLFAADFWYSRETPNSGEGINGRSGASSFVAQIQRKNAQTKETTGIKGPLSGYWTP